MEAKNVRELMEAYASVYVQEEEVAEDLQATVKSGLDAAAKFMKTNPVGKAASAVLAPVGSGRGTITKTEQERKIQQNVAKEEVEVIDEKIATGTGKKVMPSAAERSKLAKKARAGGDIGKKGKGFKAVAAKAAKQYGSKEAGERVAAAAMFKQQAHKEEFDTFDIVLEYLVSEGFAETNEAALAIMVNMSEEWKQTILEREMDEPVERDNRPDVKAHNKSVKYRPRPRRPRIEDDPRYGTPMDRGGKFKY